MQLVTVEITSESLDVPTPPIDFDFRSVSLPDIPRVRLPDIEIDPTFFRLPVPDVDSRFVAVPDVDVSSDFVDLGETPAIPVPDVDLPELVVDTNEIEVFGVGIDVVDPFGTRLVGGDVGTDFVGPIDLGFVRVPDVDVDRDFIEVPTIDVDRQTFRVPGFSQSLPSFGPFRFPSITIPTDFRLTGSIAVVDPLSLGADVQTNFDPLRQEIFGAFPDGLISDPLVWSFETAVSGFKGLIGSGGGTTLKDALEAFLDAALEDGTKERLQTRNRDDDA